MTETSKLNFVVICCASVFLSFTAFAEDLTVARGESVMLSSSHVYDTVNVSGSLTIPDGLTLQATTLNLGPNADDQAVVTVLGREDNSLKAAQVNIGGPNGGSGKIVSLARAASYESPVLSIPKVTIHANATAGEHGTIDILELGPQNVRKIVSWTNHSTVPARVRVKDGRLGYDQNFSGTYFSGPFLIEGYKENSDIIIANSWTGDWALNNGDLTISTHGTVTIDYGGNQASWNMSVNRSVVWQNIRELILKTKATYQTQDNDLLPYGKNVGPVRIDSQNACIDLKFYSSHINSLIAAKRAAGATPAVKGTKLANLIFGYDNLDGVFSGDVAPEVTVQKIGTGTLHVNGASSCGTLKLTEGTLKVTSQLDVENLIVEEGATLIVDKVHLAPSKSSCIRGSVILQNGGRCTEESVVSSDDFSRIEGISSKGRLIKDGSGTCLLAGSQSVAEEIHVKNGTLDFCAGGYHAKLFKFNFTNWTKVGYTENWREGEFLLDEIALIDASWHRIGYLMRADPVGTSPATLRPGYAAFAENTFCEVPVNQLFDATDIPRVRVTSPLTTDPGGVTIYVRLADGDPPPVAWNFATGFGGMPRAWTVSASLDNGATWEVLESQSDFTASDPLAMRWFDGAEMKLNCETIPPRFPFHSTSSLFAAPGAPNMPRAVNLRVDEGATIDFSKVEGAQQKVNALTINVDDNGGTIKNAAFEEDGVINLVSDTGHFATGDCAFQFDNCTGMNHFQS